MTIPQRIHAGTLPAAVVARSADHIAFLDHEPVARGHTLVCPVRRVGSIFELSDPERLAFLNFAEKVERAIRRALNPPGISQFMNDGPFNELGHLHLHLVPRFKDDGFTWITPHCRPHTVLELEPLAGELGHLFTILDAARAAGPGGL